MSDWNQYILQSNQFHELLVDDNNLQAQKLVLNNQATAESMSRSFTTLKRILNDAMLSNRATILSEIDGLEMKNLTSNALALIVMLIVTVVLTKVICGPLTAVATLANDIADGDLSQNWITTLSEKDELK